MLARDASRLGALAEELPGSIAIGCDVGDPAALAQALDRAAAEGGDPKVLIHNAVGGAIGSFQIGRAAGREEGVSTCRLRWSPAHTKKKTNTENRLEHTN